MLDVWGEVDKEGNGEGYYNAYDGAGKFKIFQNIIYK